LDKKCGLQLATGSHPSHMSACCTHQVHNGLPAMDAYRLGPSSSNLLTMPCTHIYPHLI
jgi:hypothetical protein